MTSLPKSLRFSLCLLAFLFPLIAFPVCAQTPIVHISLPKDEMFLRANVPIFGSVRMPIGSGSQFKSWKLEYGAGATPQKWILLRSSDKLVEYDPWNDGDLIWNPNKEPTGNLSNWAVGLQSYTYSKWRQNLNGIYTLRLSAEAKNGAKAETYRLVYVGEAIMRTVGGTSLSSDLRCRFSIPPFAFEGSFARVVTIIRQVPPPSRTLADLIGTEDTRSAAKKIYGTIPQDLQLQSAIYRIYPNGLITEPAGEIEIDFDQKAFVPPLDELDRSGTVIRQYNPVTRTWDSLETKWSGDTARGDLPQVSPYEAYVALFKRKGSTQIQDLHWQPETILKGAWVGKGEAGAKVTASDGSHESSVRCNSQGLFSIPFQLQPKLTEYQIKSVPPEGENFVAATKVRLAPTGFTLLSKPTLSLMPRSSPRGDFLLVNCEDSSLTKAGLFQRRYVLVTLSGADRTGEASFELAEAVPGSGLFMGEIFDKDLVSNIGRSLKEPFSLRAGNSIAWSISLPDYHPPEVTLDSRTHPAFFFATPGNRDALSSFHSHSQSQVLQKGNAWMLISKDARPSARMTRWNTSSFPVASWPIIGFTYKLYEKAPWQLLLRSGNRLSAYYFSPYQSNFPKNISAYTNTQPLEADGKWHFWQGNLQSGQFKSISEIAFGSWLQTAYYQIEPGFRNKQGDALQLRSLFIGRSYPSPLVEMNWRVTDRSKIRKLVWWVDQESEALAPKNFGSSSLNGIVDQPEENGKCQFRLTDNGRWFFHLIAEDEGGNYSDAESYPLFIFGTPSATPEYQTASTTKPPEVPSVVEEAIIWHQPDGKLTLPLKGFGVALDPNSLTLTMLGQRYPISNPSWDPVKEVLVLGAEAFKQGIPLGFHDEELQIGLEGSDLARKPIRNLPSFTVKFQSVLEWVPSENGGKIQIRELCEDTWLASWKNPTAPWSKYFPGSNNNLLSVILLKKDTVGRLLPIRWLRPIRTQKAGEQPLYEMESFSSPQSEEIRLNRNAQIPVFDSHATLVSGSPQSPLGKWVCQMTGIDPFEEGAARLITKTFTQIQMVRLDAAALKKRLDLQREETFRLDVWLPPDDGSISLKAPGRKISFACLGDDIWTRTSSSEINLKADSDWKRVSILLSRKSDDIVPQRTEISGLYYW